MEFETRTTKIKINEEACEKCTSYDCAIACSLYGRDILMIKDGKPTLKANAEEAKKRDNECISCEIHCPHDAIEIEIPLFGLEEFKNKMIA